MPQKKKPAAKKRKAGDIRDKINVLSLIEALEQHVLGNKKMKPTQVSAALALLKKTLPDISAAVPTQEAKALYAHEDALKELE